MIRVCVVLRTKVIASLGPASSTPEVIEGLCRAGVSGFRINFAHGNPNYWDELIKVVRECEEKFDKPYTLIGDLRGSSIRIGDLEGEIKLKKGETAKFILSNSSSGDEIPLPNPAVFENLEPGDIIVMDDGKVRLRVVDVGSDFAVVAALTDAIIKSRKALVVKGKEFDLPPLTNKDLSDIKYACSRGFDYIGLSYVKRASDVYLLKDYLNEVGCRAKVIAKIETRSAVNNLDEIISACDAVLVARGDLGMNFGIEEIPRIQRLVVNKARRAGKPVIVATQLLESMMENPIPTRSEAVDISVAVSEGVDALMLTGETAVGKYPIEAVKWLIKIVKTAEEYVKPEEIHPKGKTKVMYVKGVIELAQSLGAKIILYSLHGHTARYLAALRPSVPTYVGVPSINVARSINILWGLKPLIVETNDYDEGLEKAYHMLLEQGEVKIGDLVIMTYGMKGEEQLIKVRRVME